MQEEISEDFFLPFLKILIIYSRSQYAVMKRALGRKRLSESGEDLLLSLASAVIDKEAVSCLLFYTVGDFSSLRRCPPILGILNFTMMYLGVPQV